MRKGVLVVIAILVPLLFAINILRSFYLPDGEYVGMSYILSKFSEYDFNTSDYLLEVAEVGAAWDFVNIPDLTFDEWLEQFFPAIWTTISMPFQMLFLVCQDVLTVITFIIDVLGFYPGAPESAVGG